MFNQSSTAMKKDMELDQPPEDSVSKVAFAPNSNYLVASSWDNNVSCSVRMWLETGTFYLMHTTYIITSQIRCYEVQATGSICKAQQSHTGPILDCCWYQVSVERERERKGSVHMQVLVASHWISLCMLCMNKQRQVSVMANISFPHLSFWSSE